jgi:UDP-3-O-[3-hydroxymyristoyl] N-acetylglucosamine deacetylase
VTRPAGAYVQLDGKALHSGLPVNVRLAATDGPVVFRSSQGEARIDELSVVRADYGVRVACDSKGVDVDGVEHLFSALGGLAVTSGVAVELTGTELPLLDGGALAFARAVSELRVPRGAPKLRVARPGAVEVGASSYTFLPAATVTLKVEIDFAEASIGVQRAAWGGDAGSFIADIAWARTFGFRRDGPALMKAGRARGVDPAAVMVLDDEGAVEAPGLPARPGEFARHKLLDLVGDLYLFGGPPIGEIRAVRPGHGATHRAVAVALEQGILAKDRN